MVAFPLTIDAVDPFALKKKCLALYDKKCQPTVGTFIVVVDGLFCIATDDVTRGEKKVKAGTCFVYEQGGTFQAYRSIYRAIRAYLTYAKGWVTMQGEMVGSLTALAEACVASLFGVSTLGDGEFARLNTQLKDVIEAGGKGFTTNKQVRHALVVFNRTRTKTRPGSQLLGYGNSSGKLAKRLREITTSEQIVVSIGTILSQYLGKVLAIAAEQRGTVNEVLGYGTDALLTERTAVTIDGVAHALDAALIVRPTTHVGIYAAEDCRNAAKMIRTAHESGQTSGVSEAVRNLLVNVRESLDLLAWQYDLEQIVTILARPSKDKSGLFADEWQDLRTRVRALLDRVKEPFGARFKNKDTVPKIRRLLNLALDRIDRAVGRQADDPVEVKSLLIEASDAV